MRSKFLATILTSLSAVVSAISLAPPTLAQTAGDVNAWNGAVSACGPQLEAAVRSQTNAVQTREEAIVSIGHPRKGFETFTLPILQEFRGNEAKLLSANPSGYDAGEHVFRICMYDARISQLSRGSAPSSAAPQVAAAPSNAAPSAAGQRPTPAQCIADITAFREASSKRYAAGGGDAELVRQYSYQIQLFEGPCAGHPQAAAFVANGKRFLEEARGRMGSAAPPAVAFAAPNPGRSGNTSASSQPSSPQIDTGNYSNCVTRILAGEPGAGNYGRLKNSCPFPVDVRYCNDGADANSFAATMSCTGSRNWGGSGSIGAGDVATALVGGRTYWYACKQPAGVTDATYNPGQGISAHCK